MDFKIKRESFHKVTLQLSEENLVFMELFKQLLEEENPEIGNLSESEIYQKAFDFLMSDKRITQKFNGLKKKKRETIADMRVGN